MSKLTFFRGDDVSIPFTITGVDLTGVTVYFTVKPEDSVDTDSTTDAAAVIKKQTTTHSDPTNGKTIIDLSSTDTNVTPGIYKWDIQTKDASGKIQTRVSQLQDIEILADATRRAT